MAKRRRRKPNISHSVLEQARQGAVDEGSAEAAPERQPRSSASEQATATAKPPARRRRALQSAQLERRKDEGALDGEYVAELLANPTKVVTEDDLRADYGFVIKDLRNMGILAAGLFIALIVIALVLL